MAFQVALEETPIHKVRTDPTPYREAISQGQSSGKVVAITLPSDEVKKTVNVLRQQASQLGVGLRFDNHTDNGNGTTKVRFMVKAKREFSQESINKRKATMAAKRKAKEAEAKKTARKAS